MEPAVAASAADDVHAVLEGALRLGGAVMRAEHCLLGLATRGDGWVRAVLGVAPERVRHLTAFCTFAMMQPDLVVIPDMRAVAALAHLPGVRGEEPRWFAGGPIVDGGGVKRGGLALIGAGPRDLGQDDRALLATLRGQIAAHLEERRRAERLRLERQHEAGALSMLRGLLRASTTIAVIGTDLGGRIKLFSEGAERMFGVPAREAVGRTAAFLLADREAPAAPGAGPARSAPRAPPFSALIEGVGPDAPVERTWLLRRADGSLFPGAIVAAFVANDSAGASGYALVARDITEQRAAERMKDDFVSMVSHELRTPLTAIHGALGLLAGGVAGPLDEPVRELVEIAGANSDRLLRVVGDILDMQALASGRIALRFAPVDLRRAVERAAQLVAPVSAARGVAVAPRRAPEESVVEADFDRVVQVLVNLLSNAVRHSPPDSAVHVDIDAVEGALRVSVEDAGPGIPEPARCRLFQKFTRFSEEPGGTGLGLAIVKALVGLHRGAVSFRPASPRGAIFSFDLPLTQEGREPPSSTPMPSSGPISTGPISLRSSLAERRRSPAG